MTEYLGLPTLASATGGRVDELLLVVHVVMALALIVWGSFFFIPLVKFRRGRHPKAKYRGLRSRLPYVMVLMMALAEAVLLLGMSLPYWESEVAAEPPEAEEVFHVRVVAQQFAWNIHYPGPDGIYGRTDISLIDPAINNPVGLDPDDPFSKDDVTTIHLLHVPVNRPVRVELTSMDVIHSFSLPELRVKQDAVPGMAVPVRFTPTMTTADFRRLKNNDTRDFEIVCSQLCGLAHYRMRGFLTVESQAEFDAWYTAELDKKGEAW